MLEISAAISAAKAAFDGLKTAVAARDDAKIQAALGDMGARLTEAVLSALDSAGRATALHSELEDVKRQRVELQSKLDERGRYVLHEIHRGGFVYSFAGPSDSGQGPAHYLCQNCYDKGVKSVLQLSFRGDKLVCREVRDHSITLWRDAGSAQTDAE